MFIVCYRAKGRLNCQQQFFGPFTDYLAAEDFLATLPVARDCEHKYIAELSMDATAALAPYNSDEDLGDFVD